MGRAVTTIRTADDRSEVARWATKAPVGTRVEFKEVKRSLPQNARMWAMLTDVAQQIEWHGQFLSADDWKLLFLDAYKREIRTAPAITGAGFVSLGWSSSDLSKEEMTDLIELIAAFGANHGVKFRDE